MSRRGRSWPKSAFDAERERKAKISQCFARQRHTQITLDTSGPGNDPYGVGCFSTMQMPKKIQLKFPKVTVFFWITPAFFSFHAPHAMPCPCSNPPPVLSGVQFDSVGNRLVVLSSPQSSATIVLVSTMFDIMPTHCTVRSCSSFCCSVLFVWI